MNAVAGIDVGGPKKGYHAVALNGTSILSRLTSSDPFAIAAWCEKHRVSHLAIDAPCGWSRDGRSRDSERALMAQQIGCFSTPLRTTAAAHPKNHFGWMLAGEALYAAVTNTHALFEGRWDADAKYCAETFPHAVVCALSGTVVSAKKKAAVRREVLRKIGIDESQLPNIDFVDAALCAIVAAHLQSNTIKTLGSASDGLIVVPHRQAMAPPQEIPQSKISPPAPAA